MQIKKCLNVIDRMRNVWNGKKAIKERYERNAESQQNNK